LQNPLWNSKSAGSSTPTHFRHLFVLVEEFVAERCRQLGCLFAGILSAVNSLIQSNRPDPDRRADISKTLQLCINFWREEGARADPEFRE